QLLPSDRRRRARSSRPSSNRSASAPSALPPQPAADRTVIGLVRIPHSGGLYMRLTMLPVALCCAATLAFAATTMQTGQAGLKSAGALAVGPDGILFVGDSTGGAIFALDVNDTAAAKSS